LGLSLGAPAFASDEAMRVVIVVRDEADRRWADRVAGQTSDLYAELIRVEARDDAVLEEPLTGSEPIADTHGAEVVTWIRREEGRWLVHVVTPRSGRLLLRRVKTSGGATGDPSAALEASALIVRTAVRALSAGGAIGVERAAAADGSTKRGTTVPAPRPGSPKDAGVGPRWLAAVGWQSSVDGESDIGQQAVALGLGAAFQRFEMSVSGAVSIGADLRDPVATLRVARHRVAARAAARFTRGDYVAALGLTAGAMVYQRSTTPRSAGVKARPPGRTVSFTTGPELSLRFMPGAWGLGVTLGVDVVPKPPRFSYLRDGRLSVAHTPWKVQPRVALELRMGLP
jgi:hypothetical protein